MDKFDMVLFFFIMRLLLYLVYVRRVRFLEMKDSFLIRNI